MLPRVVIREIGRGRQWIEKEETPVRINDITLSGTGHLPP